MQCREAKRWPIKRIFRWFLDEQRRKKMFISYHFMEISQMIVFVPSNRCTNVMKKKMVSSFILNEPKMTFAIQETSYYKRQNEIFKIFTDFFSGFW